MTPSRQFYVIKGDLDPIPSSQAGFHVAIYILLPEKHGAALATTAAGYEEASGKRAEVAAAGGDAGSIIYYILQSHHEESHRYKQAEVHLL